MRVGDKIVGFEALHRWRNGMNRHIIDRNGRGIFCTCMPSIRHNNGSMWMKIHHRSKAYHLEQWYLKYKFERNIERFADQRRKHEV